MVADRVGKWIIITAGSIGQTFSLLLYSAVSEVTWFYPIRIIHGLTMAAFLPTAISITLDLASSGKRGNKMGQFLTSMGVASMLGPFLCTLFLNYVDYVQLFRLASVFPIIGLIPFLLAHRQTLKTNSFKEETPNFLQFVKYVYRSRNMLVLSYVRLAFSFTNAFFITLFAVHAESNLLLVSSAIALLFGVKGIANMTSRIPSGKLADKIGCKWPIFLAFTMLTMTFLVLSESNNIHFLIFVITMFGLAHGMRAVSEWSLLGESTSSDMHNIATAYLSTIFNIGMAFGGVVGGALSIFLDIPSIFKLASVLVLSGAFSVLLIKTDPHP